MGLSMMKTTQFDDDVVQPRGIVDVVVFAVKRPPLVTKMFPDEVMF